MDICNNILFSNTETYWLSKSRLAIRDWNRSEFTCKEAQRDLRCSPDFRCNSFVGTFSIPMHAPAFSFHDHPLPRGPVQLPSGTCDQWHYLQVQLAPAAWPTWKRANLAFPHRPIRRATQRRNEQPVYNGTLEVAKSIVLRQSPSIAERLARD